MNSLNVLKEDVRKKNINNSPKKNGSSDIDSKPYLDELGILIEDETQAIQFRDNNDYHIHRWTPYIQGFSASFVQSTLDKHKYDYVEPKILDPFSGSGTVVVQSKVNGLYAFGNEINPWMADVANVKVNALKINTLKLRSFLNNLRFTRKVKAPSFLQNTKHFDEKILSELRKLKYSINNSGIDKEDAYTQKSLEVAFASILIPCSNLKRSPCLGYKKGKIVYPKMVKELFIDKINEIISDVEEVRQNSSFRIDDSRIVLSSSGTYKYQDTFDLVITSPPYMNGMDYAINYKIEMSWLDFVDSHAELKKIKEEMVVCDNVSKKLIRDFGEDNTRYTNTWIETIKKNINQNIEIRGSYRRLDMAEIVHKYFDDMYKIMKNVISSINKGGRFVLVVGDSLIVDEYVPTDLILAKIGVELGMEIESLVKARNRRSGQIRSYKLRETILTLKK
jgi:DNA modification methylase